MAKCPCGSEAAYVGLSKVEGCTNKACPNHGVAASTPSMPMLGQELARMASQLAFAWGQGVASFEAELTLRPGRPGVLTPGRCRDLFDRLRAGERITVLSPEMTFIAAAMTVESSLHGQCAVRLGLVAEKPGTAGNIPLGTHLIFGHADFGREFELKQLAPGAGGTES